jgi:hypothetical protein
VQRHKKWKEHLSRGADDAASSRYLEKQNDAAEFLMLLVSHLEDALKGTRHAPLIRREFGGKLAQQVIPDGL